MAELEMPSRSRLRALSLAVFVIVAAMAVAGALVTRNVVNDQESKLLKQRTNEAALYVSGIIGGVLQGQLASMAVVAAGTGGSTDGFAQAAQLATSVPNGFGTLALVDTTGEPRLVAAGGESIVDLGAVRTETIQRATTAASDPKNAGTALAGTPAIRVGDSTHIGFAYASLALPGRVIYAESETHPEVPSPTTKGAPFSELNAAVYAGTSIDTTGLIISSLPLDEVPLTGETSRASFDVGVDKWTIVAKAKHSLVGSAAAAMPWVILAGGLLAALLAAAVVETLARRREYAISLVKLRTEELQESLVELSAAHEQLVRQERLAAIGQLASTIGHELRNPLGVISNAVYLLRSDFGPEPAEPAKRHLATAEREISAATVIVSDLLEFARERTPVRADVDIAALVDEVLSVLPPPTGTTARADVPRDGLTVNVDRDMLRQVLLNLVGNAYQAMPEGGELVVRVTERDGAVRVAVTDTGTGMDEDTRARLFEPFFTTKARGVGLGLAVSKRIVEAHRGTIDVESVPGRGTTFTIGIPPVTVPVIATPRTADPSETAAEVNS